MATRHHARACLFRRHFLASFGENKAEERKEKGEGKRETDGANEKKDKKGT